MRVKTKKLKGKSLLFAAKFYSFLVGVNTCVFYAVKIMTPFNNLIKEQYKNVCYISLLGTIIYEYLYAHALFDTLTNVWQLT
jgi:hypothetical protein